MRRNIQFVFWVPGLCTTAAKSLSNHVLNILAHSFFSSVTVFMTILLLFNRRAIIIYYEIRGYGNNKASKESASVHVQIIT